MAERLESHIQAQATSEEVRFTDGNVVLARAGVTVSNVHSGDFKHLLKIATRGLGSVTVTRSWNALDAAVGGARLHFVNTQLEAYSAAVRLQQAQELVAGPLKSKLEAILAGDLNSSANLPTPPTARRSSRSPTRIHRRANPAAARKALTSSSPASLAACGRGATRRRCGRRGLRRGARRGGRGVRRACCSPAGQAVIPAAFSGT